MTGFDPRQPHHLPNRRPGGRAARDHLPEQRRGVTPQMIGRYPDYDILEQAEHWDEATRRVVLARLQQPPPMRFFSAEEEPLVRTFCDTVMAQDREPRIPVTELVDARLAEGRTDGYRYATLPESGEVWRRVLRALDEASRSRFAIGFAQADEPSREALIEELSTATLHTPLLDGFDVEHAWTVMMSAVVDAFYAHPWAWNEIGFAGPAYPRGMMRLNVGTGEPYERPPAYELDPVRQPPPPKPVQR